MTRKTITNVVGFDDAPFALLEAATSFGSMPEPLRLAHIIAGGIENGWSHGRT